jgi:sulfur relay (sulfurtransferase) DsrF/TusC family protein
MSKHMLIILRRAPYGRLDAGEAIRHLNGAVAQGLDARLLLMDDGVHLARAGQAPPPGWTGLSSALEDALKRGAGDAVFVHQPSLETRGLRDVDLVHGCRVVDDEASATLLANADASLIY